jgi:hypothetical protein
VYDGKFIGPEYDKIFMSYDDGATVFYGHEQYWFWEGKKEHSMWLRFTNLPAMPCPTKRALDPMKRVQVCGGIRAPWSRG